MHAGKRSTAPFQLVVQRKYLLRLRLCVLYASRVIAVRNSVVGEHSLYLHVFKRHNLLNLVSVRRNVGM